MNVEAHLEISHILFLLLVATVEIANRAESRNNAAIIYV